MGKIAFIDPPGWQGAASGWHPSPNIGIAYLAAAVKTQGHSVTVIDLNNERLTANEVLTKLQDFRADIVALSVKTATIRGARQLARYIKPYLTNTPLLVGGPHTIFAWRDLVRDGEFDAVFVGEGEQAFPEMCRRILEGLPIEEVTGVVTQENCLQLERLVPVLNTEAELDDLPFPDYKVFSPNVLGTIQKDYILVSSRGCLYRCTYCSVPRIAGRSVRQRSSRSIINELEWARQTYGSVSFQIVDDAFNARLGRCKAICKDLADANLRMNWSCPNGLRADRIDEELAQLMSRAGCRSVMVGVESADPDILATVNKGETIEKIEMGIGLLQKAGIEVGGYFIIGLPGDSLEAQQRSVEFVKRLGISAHFNMLVPYPGTKLWDWAQTSARFLRDPEDSLHFADHSERVKPVLETDDFTASDRQRAYEMVHTCIQRFDLLIPSSFSRWASNWVKLKLIVKHDPHALRRYVSRAALEWGRAITETFITPLRRFLW